MIQLQHMQRYKTFTMALNKYIFGILMVFFVSIVFTNISRAQQLSKEELELVIKSMKQAGASPEAIEQFRKSVNAQDMASGSNVSGNISKLLTDFSIPARNEQRIKSVPKQVYNNSQLKKHLIVIVQKLDGWMNENDRKMVDFILQLPESNNPDNLAALANSFWMCANYNTALILMGKAALMKPDVDKLNNFAAFLEMMGGEELALPILQRLNHDFPGNSTVLNNIGQAWFGLGDLEKAQKYLDSALLIFPAHPQANLTCAVIAESKGDINKAVQLLRRSITNAYSKDKENMLSRLGYEISEKDFSEKIHVPEDALGFDKWIAEIPKWPMNVMEVLELKPAWDEFFNQIETEEASLREKMALLQKQWNELLNTSAEKGIPVPLQHRPVNLGPKASILFRYYAQDRDGRRRYQTDKIQYDGEWWTSMADSLIQQLNQKMLAIKSKYEGDPQKEKIMCEEMTKACNEFIGAMNLASQTYFKPLLDSKKKEISDDAYFGSITAANDLDAEMAAINAKLKFLDLFSTILRPTIVFDNGLPPTICIPEQTKKAHFRKLRDFDDINCNNKVEFTMPGIGSWGFYCNKSTFNFKPMFSPLGVSFIQNLNTNEFITGSVSIGKGPADITAAYDFENEKGSVDAGIKIGKKNLGPIELSAKATTKIEFDRSGISDVSIGVETAASAGNDIGGVKIGNDTRIGWNSGISGKTEGSITGIAGEIMNMK